MVLTYEDGPADHVWSYWDQMIQKFFDWLPLDGSSKKDINMAKPGTIQK